MLVALLDGERRAQEIVATLQSLVGASSAAARLKAQQDASAHGAVRTPVLVSPSPAGGRRDAASR